MEDDDAVGLGEDRSQVVVDVDRVIPALSGAQEGRDHVGLHRAGTEERDVDDDVVEVVGCELADELALPGRLDLETAERARGLDEGVRRRVVEGDGIEVDAFAVDALDLGDGMGEGGLHAHAQDVELEQPESLDVVLVEGAHRIALRAGLDRRAVEEGGVGEEHTARVHGDVAGQAVEALDQVPEVVELTACGHTADTGVA